MRSHGTDRRAAGDHCRTVLALTDPLPPVGAAAEELAAWAASGAMSLTGRVDGDPLGPPAGLVGAPRRPRRASSATRRAPWAASSTSTRSRCSSERAAIAGLHRRGTHQRRRRDPAAPRPGTTWIAVSLARPDDVALVPAWLELESASDDPWADIAAAAAHAVRRATLVGAGAARSGCPPRCSARRRDRPAPVRARTARCGAPARVARRASPSSSWARCGPARSAGRCSRWRGPRW